MTFRNRLRGRAVLILPGVLALLLVAVLQSVGIGPLDRVSLLLFDSFQRTKPRLYQDAGVKIVDIDEETLRRLGQWPWPRTDVADLTQKLMDAGAATVAYDIVFSEPDRTSPARLAERVRRQGGGADVLAALGKLPDNDAALAATLGNSNAVLAYFLSHDGKGGQVQPKMGFAIAGSPPRTGNADYNGAIQPLPVLRDAASGLGFVSLPADSDGIVRKAPLIATENGQLLPSLSLEALRTAYQTQSVIVKSSDASGEYNGDGSNVVSLQVGDSTVPTTPAGALFMYFTAPHPERVVPAWKVLNGRMTPAAMQREFGGHIVFVGASAQGLHDLIATPIADRELGVMVHAQAVEQIITKSFLLQPDWGPGVERAELLLLGLLMAVWLPWLGAFRGALLGLVMIGGMLTNSWLAFSRDQLLFDPTYPVIGLLLIYLCSTGFTFWREERQRAYIHHAFDRYLSPTLVKRIVDDPGQLELGGEEREMTVLFCDIRSFSRISETLSPQEIIRFLIAFLTPMCDILLDRKATIDKFIGDAILAFWNAPLDDPDQHANAARGALAMVARLEKLNVDMPTQSEEPWPGEVNIGIGLNSGPCCVGNMGSAQRLSYSLIGDTVNLASRIEGLTKYYGVRIAIGAALEAHLPGFATITLDRVRVVGRDAPERIFALLGDEAVAATPDFVAFSARHAAMLDAYWAQDWAAADAALDAGIDTAADYGLAKHYYLMRERIEQFRADGPGDDWDGVFAATEK